MKKYLGVLLLAGILVFSIAAMGMASAADDGVLTEPALTGTEEPEAESVLCSEDCEREMQQKRVQLQKNLQMNKQDGSGEFAGEGRKTMANRQLRQQLNKGGHSTTPLNNAS